MKALYMKKKVKTVKPVVSTCPGSGLTVMAKDAWNIHNKKARWTAYNEGWRTTCPACGKESAVGPRNKAIQKHAPMKPKPVRLTKAEKLAQKQERLENLYVRTYEQGKMGIGGLRPDTYDPPLQGLEERQMWIMAYMDGLADGGHTMKLGAFKRWLAKN